jgi:hypothetical protein
VFFGYVLILPTFHPMQLKGTAETGTADGSSDHSPETPIIKMLLANRVTRLAEFFSQWLIVYFGQVFLKLPKCLDF